jgi:hypothetical protein
MSNAAPLCTHIKANGIVCGSPAVSGTSFCYHHSVVKTALDKVQKGPKGVATPIPFVFAEDRASMQINYFLLLQAFNEQRIDLRTYNAFLGLLRSMARNLGKTGSLVEDAGDQGSGCGDQKGKDQGSGAKAQQIGDIAACLASAELKPESCFLNAVADSDRNPFKLRLNGMKTGRLSAEGRHMVGVPKSL